MSKPMNQLVSLFSRDGTRWLQESIGLAMGVRMLGHLVTQDALTYCGPATAAVILNALDIEPPVSPAHAPHRLFTQEGLLAEKLDGPGSRASVSASGTALSEFIGWFERPGLKARVVHADHASIDSWRESIRQACGGGGRYALAMNYHRPVLGQEGGGHFSPVGPYHPGTDRVLILDVARYRYPPVWAAVSDTFMAMQGIDPSSGMPRGFAVIERPDAPQGQASTASG